MKKSPLARQHCSVAQTLALVGEWWTLLIVREAFFGTRRFGDFQARLGVARNILTRRLNALVAAGILSRHEERGRGGPVAYRLTESGRDLLPVIIALLQWGDRWIYGQDAAPARIVEAATGKDVAPVSVRAEAGQTLMPRDLLAVAGPGADEAERARFAAMQEEAADRRRARQS